MYLCVGKPMIDSEWLTECVWTFTADCDTFFPKLLNILPTSPHPVPIYTVHTDTNASHTRTHNYPTLLFRIQRNQGKLYPRRQVSKCNRPVKNQTGVEKHCFVNNGAQLESQIEQEQEDRGCRPQIKSLWLIEISSCNRWTCVDTHSSVW